MLVTNNTTRLYQRWLRDKFAEIEDIYYSEIDDLNQKIGDIEDVKADPEDFTLTKYSFIQEWENGVISSAEVYRIMNIMNIEQAAKAKITKRLLNHMIKYDELANVIKPVLTELNGECVKRMVRYLEMMRVFFKKMTEIDNTQMKLSWVQQIFEKDKGVDVISGEMTLNQTIHHIEAFINKSAMQRFYLKDQIVVFDEEIGTEDRAIHWIFAPRSYIELLKVLFNIKEKLGDEEMDFLKSMVKEIE